MKPEMINFDPALKRSGDESGNNVVCQNDQPFINKSSRKSKQFSPLRRQVKSYQVNL